MPIERAQYCALGSAKTSRVDIDLISEPGRVRTNPSRIQSLEPSPEPRPSLASSQAPSPEESLRIKPSCQTPNRSPSRDADTSFEQSWAKYRASNLVRPGLIPEFSRTSPRASPNQVSSQDELSLETSRAIPREPNRNQPNQGQNWWDEPKRPKTKLCAHPPS